MKEEKVKEDLAVSYIYNMLKKKRKKGGVAVKVLSGVGKKEALFFSEAAEERGGEMERKERCSCSGGTKRGLLFHLSAEKRKR